MKMALSVMLCFLVLHTQAQPQFRIHNLSLPEEIRFYNNQFSGLYIYDGNLFVMSESRLQDSAEAKLYAIKLADLERKLTDSLYSLPWQKYGIQHLDVLRNKMAAAGQQYEGLEAVVMDSTGVYFSVETATPSSDCFLIKGFLNDTAVVMDTAFLIRVAKPTAPDSTHIYNAGFEAMVKNDARLFLFFEFNYFPNANYVYAVDSSSFSNNHAHTLPIKKLPFRITDITHTEGNHFTAINYFFNGDGADAVYRTPDKDKKSTKLIKEGSKYKSYCRLIDIVIQDDHFTWKPLWEFPQELRGYNWEGIAAYKKGYFIMNDKYTPAKPYQSTLLYLERIK